MIAILGYGPAGMIAAHTLVRDCGVPRDDIHIMGIGDKSVIGGAQYLHEPVLFDGEEPDGEITFVKIGDRDGYARKVYNGADVSVSWDHYEGVVQAWALGATYDQLWELYKGCIIEAKFDAQSLTTLVSTGSYDQVFSSIPAQLVCYNPDHGFPKARIALVRCSPIGVDNLVMYSGRQEDQWYRTSRIFGEGWMEFGADAASTAEYMDMKVTEDFNEDEPVVMQTHPGFKPLGTNCDCHPSVTRIGRFGRWDKKMLLHHVPGQVREAMDRRTAV